MNYLRNLAKAIIGRSFDLTSMSDDDVREFIRTGGGNASSSGRAINELSAMKVAAAWRCVNIITGVIGSLPVDVIRRDGDERHPAVGHPLRRLLKVRPNQWQTSSQFRKYMQAWLLLRGNAYALKVRSPVNGELLSLVPLSPDMVEVEQSPSGSLVYKYTDQAGKEKKYKQSDIFHLAGLSLDGITGLSVISYMRESLSLSLDSEAAASTLMKNGTFTDAVITVPERLSKEAYERLKEHWRSRHEGAENAGKLAVLEQGSKIEKLSMTADDLQFLEQRDFQRYDIAMFYGVPPHMIGATSNTTTLGSSIESMSIGFVLYTLADWFATWEQALRRDCIDEQDQENHVVKFNTWGLLRGDSKAQWDAFTRGRQWGVFSPNDIRRMLDMNPRTDEGGDEYAVPPNETKDQTDA